MGWLVGLALPGSPGYWALLGMAAMLGGTMRAPLTGALFAVELTGDLPMLPALVPPVQLLFQAKYVEGEAEAEQAVGAR